MPMGAFAWPLTGGNEMARKQSLILKSTVASWAQEQGLTEVSDATRTDDLKGPWDVLGSEGTKVGRLESNMNFDL